MLQLLTNPRTRVRPWLFGLLVVLLAAAALFAPAIAGSSASGKPKVKPTVVLVHGAFADASGWAGVTERLQRRGYTVIAPTNPLRGVASDAAYLRTFLSTINGPILLVGHSYGGVVITNAATGNPNVKALVYIAAFAPDEGDSVGSLGALVPGGMIGPATLTLRPFPPMDLTVPPEEWPLEGYINSDVFRHVFAADLPKTETDIMAASQRPAALQTLGEPSGPPAWKTIPSWYLVAGQDNAVGTELERFMAKRMGAKTVEIKGASHVVMISRPEATTRLILDAAGTEHGH